MMNLNELNEKFDTASPQDILRWAIETYGDKAALSSSFGSQSAALIHMAIQIKPDIPILFLNTGFLFKETLEFKDQLKTQFHLNIREFSANEIEIKKTQTRLNDPQNKKGACCDDVKVRLMKDSLLGVECWIAGLRRQQGAGRQNIKIVESASTGLVKVHPLANITSKALYAYMQENHLPFHPLWEKGYTSIGCAPCTQLPLDAQNERSGRWAGTDKTECGIHTFLK